MNGRYVPTGAMMPSFANVLTDDAMTAVIDYIFEQQVTGGPAVRPDRRRTHPGVRRRGHGGMTRC